MKFAGIATLAAVAGTALAQNCGSECQAGRTPNTVLSGDVRLVAVVDKDDASIKYKCGGQLIIQDDCHFTLDNFYVYPQPKNAKWSCSGPSNSGIGLTNPEKTFISEVNPDSPTSITYDISDVNTFCHASLIDDCKDFTLVDENWQVICNAVNVNPGASGASGSSSGGSSQQSSSQPQSSAPQGTSQQSGSNVGSNTGKMNSGSTTSSTSTGGKTSDATTSKWSMALLGLSSLAAFLLA